MTTHKIENYLKMKHQKLKATNEDCPKQECNFADNYYGDQVCLLKPGS